jgi:hypothetical protein
MSCGEMSCHAMRCDMARRLILAEADSSALSTPIAISRLCVVATCISSWYGPSIKCFTISHSSTSDKPPPCTGSQPHIACSQSREHALVYTRARPLDSLEQCTALSSNATSSLTPSRHCWCVQPIMCQTPLNCIVSFVNSPFPHATRCGFAIAK